jgi:hypothetical protein
MPLPFALACGHSLPCWKFPVCDILRVTGRHIDRLDSIQDTSTFCQYGPLDRIFRSIKNLKLPKHLNEPYAGSDTMTVFDAYYDSLIGGEGAEQMIPPYRLFSYHSSKEILREVLNGEDNYDELREKYKDIDRYFDSVYYHCENRTLFTTEQGYVGIGPKFAQAVWYCVWLVMADGRLLENAMCLVSWQEKHSLGLSRWITAVLSFWTGNRGSSNMGISMLRPESIRWKIQGLISQNIQK